jgi:GST-like protein
MLRVLRECGALARILPELEALFGVPQPAEHHPEVDTGEHMLLVLDYAAAQGFPLEVRFAALAHDLGKGATPRSEWPRHIGHEERGAELARQLCERLRVPHECRDLALLAARHHGVIHRALELKPATVLKLLQQCDALRKPRRFAQLLDACACDFHGRTGHRERPYPQAGRLQAALAAAQAVDAGAIARTQRDTQRIKEQVARARLDAIRRALGAEQVTTRRVSRQEESMIDLYTWTTPNGRKVSIMLEEIGLPYRVHPINIGQGDQFKPEYVAICPNSKIPALVDPDGPDGKPYAMMESGAILIYLAGKTGKLLPKSDRGKYDALQWLMFQMGGIGPIFGQVHHFLRAAKEPVPYAIARYGKEKDRLYGVLDRRLGEAEYLAGQYSIADIATYPWVARYEWHKTNLADFPHVKRWFDAISARPAVQRGMKVPVVQ